MSQSVSFILPVRDFEQELRGRAQSILEVLSELTSEFDLLIVDYGSQDESAEVARDLVREYPQIDFCDDRRRGDFLGAIETGIQRTTGQIIFVHDVSLPLSISAIQGLWQLRDDEDLVMAQSRSLDEPTTVRSHAFDRSSRANLGKQSSIQMIRRVAMPPQSGAAPRERMTVDRVTRTDLIGQSPEATRLPKLLSRLRRIASP